MKEAKLKIIVLENQKDVDAYRASSVGNMVLPIGTVLISACVEGNECGTIPFIPNGVDTGLEQAETFITSNIIGKLDK